MSSKTIFTRYLKNKLLSLFAFEVGGRKPEAELVFMDEWITMRFRASMALSSMFLF